MEAPETTFWKLQIKTIFFHQLKFSSVSRLKVLEKVSAFCHIQLQYKVTEHFQNGIKKMWRDPTKIALGGKDV